MAKNHNLSIYTSSFAFRSRNPYVQQWIIFIFNIVTDYDICKYPQIYSRQKPSSININVSEVWQELVFVIQEKDVSSEKPFECHKNQSLFNEFQEKIPVLFRIGHVFYTLNAGRRN